MRVIATGVALIAAAAVVACGGDDEPAETTTAEPTTAEAAGGAGGLFSSGGFSQALDAIEAEVGADAGLLEIQLEKKRANFTVRRGEQADGFRYTAGGGVKPIKIEIVGSGSFEGRDFPLADIDPAAVDKIVSGVREDSGADDFEPTTLTLEKDVSGVLRWLIIGFGRGQPSIIYYADPDGTNIQTQKEVVGSVPGAP